MVLRKRRYRDLKKVGIGGFLAKTRAPKTALSAKKDEETEEKKRPTWRPKKNKILVQYPEYIQAWSYQEETLFLIRSGFNQYPAFFFFRFSFYLIEDPFLVFAFTPEDDYFKFVHALCSNSNLFYLKKGSTVNILLLGNAIKRI
jgi:hypothetical protein